MKCTCKIVMYHYVRPIKKSKYPEIKGLELDGFIRQIEYFKSKFNFMTAAELVDSIYNNRVPQNAVLLTFDDGFKDHYLHVFPILKKLGIQGLFFPPVKPIEEHSVMNVNKIQFIIANAPNEKTIIEEIFALVNQYKRQYELLSPDEYFSNLAVASRLDSKEVIFIKRILQRELPSNLRNEFTNYLFKKYVTNDEKSFSKELYLSLDEIKEMKESGMYFGSKGYSDVWLSRLSYDDLKLEIKKGLDLCNKINTTSEDLIMCYNWGDYNEQTIDELKRQGFKAGLTTIVGDAELNLKNAFLLKRYDTNDFPQ